MKPIVPNLDELLAALDINSPGYEVASAFAAETIEMADDALRSIVAAWESGDESPAPEAPAA